MSRFIAALTVPAGTDPHEIATELELHFDDSDPTVWRSADDFLADQRPDIPLPGSPLLGGTVVASVWQRDEPPCLCLVLLLFPAPLYYGVVQLEVREGTWTAAHDIRHHPNIVPALEDYTDNGGDY